jgi:hypothetical protein
MVRVRRWVSFALLAFAVGAPAARAVPIAGTVLVDRPTGFGALPFDGFAASYTTEHSLSADGRYAVFSSASNALLTGETSATNVYRVDLTTGAIVQVDTTASGGQPTPGSESGGASISADGNYVGFITTSPALDPAASSDNQQFVVKNLTTGALEDASVANGPSGAAVTDLDFGVLSGDGRHVAFTANSAVQAANAAGVAGTTDAYLRSLNAGTTQMVSVTSTGAEGGGVRSAPAVDYGGDAVGFATTSQLVPGDTDTGEDAYVYIVGAPTPIVLASFSGGGQTADADIGFDVAVAGGIGSLDVAWDDGIAEWIAPCSTTCTTAAARIDHAKTGGSDSNSNEGGPFFGPEPNGTLPARVYWTTDDGLDPADTNNAPDIYGWDIGNNAFDSSIHLMTGGQENQGASSGSATQTGAVTAFSSSSSNLPGADGAYSQVYERQAGADTNISQPLGQAPRTDTAGDGFVDSLHATSDDGRLVAFGSDAPAFGAPIGTEGPLEQILVRNVLAGQTQLASVASEGASGGNGNSDDPGIDAAGDRVVFDSDATNLVPGDTNGATDVFMRNLSTGQTTLVDRTAGGGFPIQGADDPEISADGTKVVYRSDSVDIPGAPPDGNDHVYELDLATGDVTLIDQTTTGVPGNDDAGEADLDGNGERVAFTSRASNLGGGTSSSIYVRDLTNPAHPTTTWVSVPQDGLAANDDAFEPSIDGAGEHVAWAESNASFGFGINSVEQIFVRNLATKMTTLVSSSTSGAGNQESYDPSLSDDGSRVAFGSQATNLPGAIANYDDVFVRNLTAGTTVLASTVNGGANAGRFGADNGSLSGNGDCLAFDSSSDNLVTGGYGSDFEHVFLHALNGACPQPAAPPPAPVISKLSVTNKRFALGPKATALSARAKKPPRGTTFKFTLSEAASTRIVITEKRKGHRKSRRQACKPARRGQKRNCSLTLTVLTLVRAHTAAGANAVAFSGRYGHKHLATGTYRATLTATSAAGKRSRSRSVSFAVVG